MLNVSKALKKSTAPDNETKNTKIMWTIFYLNLIWDTHP